MRKLPDNYNETFKEELLTGQILLIDKPYQWSSFDLVKKIRNIVGTYLHVKKPKVGHAGTLDPLATGLMILCVGKKTKEIDSHQAKIKEYIATFKIGATTPSYDRESKEDNFFSTEHITNSLIKTVLNQFIGEQWQTPPIFSAKKIDGKRAYLNAREGIEMKMEPVRITIQEMELVKGLDFNNEIVVRIVCSKGTYIRTIAYDLGVALNSGAYMTQLCRTKIGEFTLQNAVTLEEFRKFLFPDS